jgi:hypothetical protein
MAASPVEPERRRRPLVSIKRKRRAFAVSIRARVDEDTESVSRR